MVILLTGATSKIGQILLTRLVANPQITKIYALTRSPSKIRAEGKIEVVQADLTDSQLNLSQLPMIDLCIHLAGLTHTSKESLYFHVNHTATMKLALNLKRKGTSRFWYVSSQTAGQGAGTYALSKFLAEQDLLSLDWQQLLIFRPSEVVGAGGNEGLDKFIYLSKKFRICPWLFSYQPIRFSPIQVERVVDHFVSQLDSPKTKDVQVIRGEPVTSTQFAFQMLKKYGAIPLPIFIPALDTLNRILSSIGIFLLPRDQVARLMGAREQKPVKTIEIKTIVMS